MDGRTTGRASFHESMKLRPRIEKLFGWLKLEGRMRQTRFRGPPKVAQQLEFLASA